MSSPFTRRSLGISGLSFCVSRNSLLQTAAEADQDMMGGARPLSLLGFWRVGGGEGRGTVYFGLEVG